MTTSDPVGSFRALHAGQRILALPNAWDAGSAALFRSDGAPAIATTSAGLAWSCGYPDGNTLPRAALLFAVEAIVRVAGALPVSIDLEAGYSDDPSTVAELVDALRALGVAGINLEDGAGSAELLAVKIQAIKGRLAQRNADVFINARTDVFLRKLAQGDAAVSETIARVKRYAAAGADGMFVPRLSTDAFARVASATSLPLNLMAVPGLPAMRDLYAMGVRRLSAGSSLAELALGTARNAALAFVRDANSEALFSEASIDYPEMNSVFQSEAGRV